MPKKPFPLLILLVSGGHTQLILMNDHHNYKIIGQTRDDAAGEAFDKVASMLGLSYPGGPEISKMAKKGDPHSYQFTIPLRNEKTFDFSFSGTKTQALRHIQDEAKITNTVIQDISASFEAHMTKVLLRNLFKAAQKSNAKTIAITGGVSANTHLRKTLKKECAEKLHHKACIIPKISLTTDNAAMIARAAFEQYTNNDFANLDTVANPRMTF